MNKKLKIECFLLILGCFGIAYSLQSLPLDQNQYRAPLDQEQYRACGFVAGICAGCSLSYLMFRPIHQAFKANPIASPYKQFFAKRAVALGYLFIICNTAAIGDDFGDKRYHLKLLNQQKRNSKNQSS